MSPWNSFRINERVDKRQVLTIFGRQLIGFSLFSVAPVGGVGPGGGGWGASDAVVSHVQLRGALPAVQQVEN